MIVGGGIAGSALAILLAEAGRRVTLLERSAGPHHSVCGEFLSPEAIVYLRALGIDPLALGAQPITHVRLAARELIAETRLPRPALSLTRCTLDEALRTRAAEAGAVVQRGTNVERLTRSGDQWQAECVQSGGRRAVLFASRAYLATGKYDLRGWARRAGTDRTADAYPAPSDLRQSNVLSSAQHAKGSLTQPPGQKEHRMQAESSGTNGQPGTDGRPAPWSLQTNLVAFKMYFHLDPAQHAALAEHVELILFPGGYTGLQTVEGGAANLCTLLTRDRLRSLGGWRQASARPVTRTLIDPVRVSRAIHAAAGQSVAARRPGRRHPVVLGRRHVHRAAHGARRRASVVTGCTPSRPPRLPAP
jgi:hypothetical protein